MKHRDSPCFMGANPIGTGTTPLSMGATPLNMEVTPLSMEAHPINTETTPLSKEALRAFNQRKWRAYRCAVLARLARREARRALPTA